MVTRTLLAGLAVAAMLLPMPAAAQDATAPHPDAAVTVLYAHSNVDNVFWMNSLADDATGPETSARFAPNAEVPAYGESPAGPHIQESFIFEFPLAPGLVSGLVLDPAGSVEVSAFIGGGAYTLGEVTVSTKLMAGDTLIAEGAAKSHRMTPKPPTTVGCQVYDPAGWSMEVVESVIPADAPLTWIIEGSGSWNNIFVATSECRGRSNIALPITGLHVAEVPPAVHLAEITDGLVELDVATASSDTYIFNWTTELTRAQFNLTATSQQGSVALTVTDAAGAKLFDVPSANGTKSKNVTEAAPGQWQVTVKLDDFRGSLRLAITELPEAEQTSGGGAPAAGGQQTAPAGGSGGTAGSTPSAGAGAGLDEAPADDKESPGAGLLVLLAALCVALVARRR